MANERVEFTLTAVEASGSGDVDEEAALTSPLLDPMMHPKGKAAVRIEPQGSSVDSTGSVQLDPFQRESLMEYLRLQHYVRQTLEMELPRDQEQWDPEGDPVRGELWSWAKVLFVELRQRNVPTRENLRLWKRKGGFSEQEVEAIVAASDKPETRSYFSVTLKCDWDAEHFLEAEFRDGVFVGLAH